MAILLAVDPIRDDSAAGISIPTCGVKPAVAFVDTLQPF